MEKVNMAYDLSFYELEQERHIARKEKKEGILIKAQTKFSLGKRIMNIVSVAVVLSLMIALVATNAAITAYGSDITRVNAEITELESEKSYLEFTLESRMSLDEIEKYAVNNLGMVKMEVGQKKYVELESENKITVADSSVKEKLSQAMQPLMSYLLP